MASEPYREVEEQYILRVNDPGLADRLRSSLSRDGVVSEGMQLIFEGRYLGCEEVATPRVLLPSCSSMSEEGPPPCCAAPFPPPLPPLGRQ
jgi:hypothetical protein